MTAQRLIAEVFGIELARLPLSVSDAAALLGVQPDATDAQVITALKTCLRRLDAHPLGRDEGGVEARVILHGAAARLLEHTDASDGAGGITITSPDSADHRPGLAQELARTLVLGGGWNRASMAQFAAIARREGLEMEELLGVLRQLQTGGAVQTAAERAAPAAPARPTVQTPKRQSQPARPAAPTSNSVPQSPSLPARAGPVPRSEDIDDLSALADASSAEPRMDNSGVGKALLLIGAAGGALLLTLGAVAVILIMTLRPGTTPEGGGSAASPSQSGPVASAPPAAPQQIRPAPPVSDRLQPVPGTDARTADDFAALQRELRACVEGISTDPAAACDRFDTLLLAISDRWPEGTADGSLVVVVGDMVEFVYRAGAAGDAGRRAVGRLAELAQPAGDPASLAPDGVRRGAFIAGLAARLMRERDLPTMSWSAAEAAYRRAFQGVTAPSESTFAAGASAWSGAVLPRLIAARPGTPDEIVAASRAAWGAWLESVEALSPQGSRERERAILAALDTVLTSGPETTDARWAYETVEALVLRLTWRPTDDSRRWLLRWFASPAVTTSDLHTLTRILAERSSAEGIDLSMVLSRAAGESERAQLRERFAVVWGISAPARGELITRWLDAASADAARETPSDPLAALASAVRLARLSRAARLIQSGDVGEAESLIRSETPQVQAPSLAAPVPTAPAGTVVTLTTPGSVGAPAASVASGWAPRYIAAGQNIPIRREILAGVSSVPTLIEAEVLVEEAGRGAPWQVRQAARALVERYAHERTIVEAMLRFAPVLPPTADNALLAEAVSGARLPSARSPQWRVAVRRALVERLIQVMASSGDARAVDELARLLGEAYAPALPPPDSPEDQPTDPTGSAQSTPPLAPEDLTLEAAARRLRVALQSQAASGLSSGREVLSREQIAANLAVRTKVAAGRIQDFIAEQGAIAEYLAFVVSLEQPTARREIAAILDELSRSRRTTPHAFAQIHGTERAIVSLWKIRLGGAEP